MNGTEYCVFKNRHSSSEDSFTPRVLILVFKGVSRLTGVKVATFCSSPTTISPGLDPGADDGGGPRLFAGVRTLVSTGVRLAVPSDNWPQTTFNG